VAYDPEQKFAVGLRKLKVKLLPVLPGCALPVETVMVPSPFASVNVADAVSWEGLAGGGGLETWRQENLGRREVPACVEFAVLVGHYGPRFE